MRKLFGVLALAGAVALGGCSDDDNGTGPDDSIEGTYTLESINGEDLPVTVIEFEGYKLEVLSGNIRLEEDKEFNATIAFRETENGAVSTSTESDSGTWERSGNSITFEYDDEELTDDVATYANGKLTLESEGITLVFEK